MFAFAALWSSPQVQTLAAVLYVLLSVIVTIDVLLKKSDVRGALGWIGLVWLAPILGSLLYYVFGINRVTRRALKLRMDSEDGVKRLPTFGDAIEMEDVSFQVFAGSILHPAMECRASFRLAALIAIELELRDACADADLKPGSGFDFEFREQELLMETE